MQFNVISDQLFANNLISNKNHFWLVAKLTGTMNKIRSGKYQISSGLTNWEILKKLTQGKVHLERITIPEGKTHQFFASVLQKKIEIDSARFVSLVHDTTYIRQLGIDAPSLEGYLYPDTYFLSWGMTEKQCIRFLVNQFKQKFPEDIVDPDPELSLTRHQMVILASIIEGEVQLDEERPIVSALYRNRLKRGMLLQACPTIQYILPEGPRRLLHKDLEIDSPYNTYMYPGLPPGPINNPGGESLLAAANPENVPYLYMVARGDGGHTFTRSMAGHLNAKRKFDAYRRRINRKMLAKKRKK